MGNVLYRQENWAGAAEAYEHALGVAGPDLSSRAAYNLGNALFHDEKYDEAVKAYTRALKGSPQDGDAKHNLEMALRALEQKKKEPQKKPDQQKQDQKKDDKQKAPESSEGDKKPEDGKGDAKDQGKHQEPKPGGMTPEEAQQLLDRLGDQEKKNLKHEQARRPKDAETPEKDW